MIKSTIVLLFLVAGIFRITESCDGNHDVMDQDWEFRNNQRSYSYDPYRYVNIPYLIPYYYNYPSSSIIPASDNYEGRTPSASKIGLANPFKNYQQTPKNEVSEDPAENRYFGKLSLASSLLSNNGLFHNMFGNNAANGGYHHGSKPFSKVSKWMPSSNNADLSSFLSKFDTCTAASQEEGICVPGAACSLFGGRPSGSCNVKNVCCINAVASCGSTITLNNTYWQSPVTLPSSCSLTIKLDNTLLEQSQEIAQIRLDFMSFSIAQPNADGTCATDVFRVSGADNVVPEICGDNAGQHMYLDVPSRSAGTAMTSSLSKEINLSFQLGSQSSASRMWNIKVYMLPAGSKYLAPQDCLQYYTSPIGRVRSFNWQDVAGTATRQLNNQNYNICFRTEMIDRQRANEMCVSVCPVKNGGDAFLVTSPTAATNPAAIAATAQAARDAAKLASAQTALNTAQASLTTTQTTLTTAQNAVTAATPTNMADLQAAITTAQSNLKLVQDNLIAAQNVLLSAGLAATPEQAQAVIDARTAVATAQSALTAAQAAANPPQLIAAQSALVSAQSSFNSAQSSFNSAQSSFNSAQSAYTASSSAAAAATAAASFSSASGTTFTTTTTTFGRQELSVAAGGETIAVCMYDYLLIDSGRDATNAVADRYCGNQMNPATGGTNSVQVCSPIKPFRITYHTDGTESAVVAGTNILPAPADTGNTGFCLDFQER